MISFPHDPITTILKIVNELYPSVQCEITLADPETLSGLACAVFGDDGTVSIEIGWDVPLFSVVELIAHEVAHVVVGTEEKDAHGPKWEAEFLRIHKAYEAYMDGLGENVVHVGGPH